MVLWSDHGWQLGEKTHWRKYGLWENIANVHLMISAPPGSPGLPQGSRNGANCRRSVSLQDLYPTLLDLCALPPRQDIGGHTLTQLLDNPEAPWEHPAITSVFTGDLAVSWESWRYLAYKDGGEELYNLDSDPHEWTNLAGDPRYAARKAELRAMLPSDPAPRVMRREGG